jgi:hypothetical protein
MTISTKIKLYANQGNRLLVKMFYYKTMVMAKVLTSRNGILDISKPTMAQLDAFEAEATTYENNQKNYS